MDGTYINLQDAFATEKLAVGTWLEVGYSAPGEKKSTGTGTTVSQKFESANFAYEEVANGWTAKGKVKLNDCLTTTGGWSLSAEFDGNPADGEGNVAYSVGTANACTALTPAFDKLIEGRSK